MAFKDNPRIVTTGKDTLPVMVDLPEASGQSYLVGELVYLASGTVTVCATDTSQIYGIALEAASGTGGTLRKVLVIGIDDTLRIRLTTGGTDYLNSGSSADIGVGLGLYVASNIHYCDVADSSNDRFVLQSLVKDATGAATYWVDVKLVPTVCQSATGSAA